MGIPTLNEGSRCFVKAKFFDHAENAQIPTSLSYRVDCQTTGATLLDWTTVTPDTVVEVQIDATLNVIQRRGNSIERKAVTFMANADPAASAFTSVQFYDLIALQAYGSIPGTGQYGTDYGGNGL
jgi:hypothetical protein